MESNLGSFCVGIILSLTVSAIDSVGINLLRQDHIVNNAKPASQQLPFIKRKQSVCGMALHLSSQLFGGLAVFNFLPPAVIAPIGSACLIFNLIFAYFFLGTIITKLDYIGTLLMIIGGSLTAIFGRSDEKSYDVSALMKLYQRPIFIIYFSIFNLVMISVFAFSKTIKYKYKQINTNINDYLTKIDLLKRWMGIGYSSTGALVASESVVLSHTFVKLINSSFNSENQFTAFQPYLIVLCLIFGAITQVYCTNMAVTYCDTVITAPTFFAVFSTFTLINANIYYSQWDEFSDVDLLLFGLGVLILIVGIVCISQKDRSRDHYNPVQNLNQGDKIQFDPFVEFEKEVLITDEGLPKNSFDAKDLEINYSMA